MSNSAQSQNSPSAHAISEQGKYKADDDIASQRQSHEQPDTGSGNTEFSQECDENESRCAIGEEANEPLRAEDLDVTGGMVQRYKAELLEDSVSSWRLRGRVVGTRHDDEHNEKELDLAKDRMTKK
ncbi:unnamed protein product [Fusarium graminearum]|nr:unnamed protein product [Fusarium graminearum]